MSADQDGSLEKTSEASSVPKREKTSARSSKGWPASGMMLDGVYFPLQIAGRPTDAKGSGSSPKGWPTPDANVMNDGESLASFQARQAVLKAKHGNGNGNGAGMPLAVACLYPTPQTADARVVSPNGSPYTSLAKALWPTIKASDGPNGGPNQRGAKGDPALSSAVLQWPTPVVSDMRNNASPSTQERHAPQLAAQVTQDPTLRLNPDWVECLMGWPLGWTKAAAGPQEKANCKKPGSRRASSQESKAPDAPND